VTFRYLREKSSLFGTILRPVAKIQFKDTDGNPIDCSMYIDSGADITLIPKSLGEILGLKLEEENIIEISGVGSTKVPMIIRTLSMIIGEHEIQARVAWALEEDVPPLLGRLDIFDKFDIEFKEAEEIIVFNPRE
jgi:hypothetical protein